MFIGRHKNQVKPFEHYTGAKRILVTDNGKVIVLGTTEDEHWWMCTPEDYDQGPAGVTLEELRARLAAVRQAIAASGIPADNITAFALAIEGLNSAGWGEGFNAVDFHNGVMGLSPYVVADTERDLTTMYERTGERSANISLND